MMKAEFTELKPRHLLNCYIAGFAYYEGTEVFDELKIGTKLQLIRENDNAFDPCTVAIYYQDYKLGFIPRSDNNFFATFIDLGYDDIFTITVNRVNPQEHPEKQIGIVIRLLPNEIFEEEFEE